MTSQSTQHLQAAWHSASQNNYWTDSRHWNHTDVPMRGPDEWREISRQYHREGHQILKRLGVNFFIAKNQDEEFVVIHQIATGDWMPLLFDVAQSSPENLIYCSQYMGFSVRLVLQNGEWMFQCHTTDEDMEA